MEIIVDLHIHTVASGHAYSTISENALVASRKGLKLIGMTDHGPNMPGAPHLYHFGNLSILPTELYGVNILRGVEANIISCEGELDLPFQYLSKMDIVLVGLHSICYPGGTIKQNTNSFIKAMENPFTDMIVHPDRPEFELDFELIAQTSARLGIPVEINNSSLAQEKWGAWDNCRCLARYMVHYGGPVILGSDAHFWDRVGEFEFALKIVQEVGLPESQIMNTSPKRVLDYLTYRRKSRTIISK